METKSLFRTFALTVFSLILIASESPQADEVVSLRLKPMGILFGAPGGEIDAEITPHLEIGPAFTYLAANNDSRGSDLQATETGVRVTGFFWGQIDTSAWFITGSIYYYLTHQLEEVSGLSLQQDPSVRFGSFGGTLTAGRQWMLDAISPSFGQHVNIRLGAGVGYKPGHTENVSSTAAPANAPGNQYVIGVLQRFDPTLEFTIGVLL